MVEMGFHRSGGPLDTAEDQVFFRLLGELPDAVILIDAGGGVQWGNAAAERLFGRSLQESIGISGLDLVHPEDLEFVLRALTSVHGKEVGTPIEVRLSTPAGWRLTEVIGVAVGWLEEGAVLLSLRDLTDRRRFELAYNEDARFRSLVQNAATITMLVSPSGVVTSVSGALTRLLGHDPELVEGRPLVDLVDESERPALRSAVQQAAEGASAAHPVTVRVSLLRRPRDESIPFTQGESIPFEFALVNLIDDPTVGGYVISGHDISAQVLAELEVQKTLSLLTVTLDSTADGILSVDATGRFVSFNRRFAELWRLPAWILASEDDATAIDFVRDQLVDPEAFVAKIEELNANHEAESHDVLEFKDGRVFERVSKPQNVAGVFVGRVWSFRDVTDRKRLEDRLSFQAFHDSLTGLANRALFQDRLDHAVERAERNHGHLAVLFLDLDNLKTVNDGLGHAAGDALLRSTADILASSIRTADTAARLGGDEFGILVEDLARRDDAIELADRLLTALRQPMEIATRGLCSTASIGVTFHRSGNTSDELLSNADLAMYAAKLGGGDQFAEFDDRMHGSPARAR